MPPVEGAPGTTVEAVIEMIAHETSEALAMEKERDEALDQLTRIAGDLDAANSLIARAMDRAARAEGERDEARIQRNDLVTACEALISGKKLWTVAVELAEKAIAAVRK